MKRWLDAHQLKTVISFTIAGLFIIAIYFFILNISMFLSHLGRLLMVLRPFIYGLIMAFLLGPIVAFIEHKTLVIFKLSQKAKRGISVFLALLLSIEVVVLFFSFVIPQIVNSVQSISVRLPQYVVTVERLLNQFAFGFDIPEQWINLLLSSSETFLVNIFAVIEGYIPLLLNYSLSLTLLIFNVIVGLAIAVYMLLDKERFTLQVKRATYALFGQASGDYLVELTHLSSTMIHRFILGKALDSVIIGIICYLGMLLIGLEYAILLSVIIGITNMIPVFGPFIGAVPGTLILLLVDPLQALWFVLFIIGLQQFDGNILGPKILGDSVGLPGLWIMFSIIVGGGYFGVIGMFLGVPIFAVIYIVVKRFVMKKIDQESIEIS
jgi:predicted PurR-regulated permease PerM